MKKIFLSLISIILLLITLIIIYLSVIGYETEKFNSLLEGKVKSSFSNTKIDLKKIKIKIDIKNLSFFVTTFQPNIQYYNNKINLNKIDAYINLKSLLIGKPKIENVRIQSNETDIKELKKLIKYFKPSNFKRFVLNDIERGKINFNLEFDFIENQILNYEIDGIAKNFFLSSNKINLEKSSFIYSINKSGGEIDNIRGLVNGFQISSGNISFSNSKLLEINGNLISDLNLNKKEIDIFVEKENLNEFENLNLIGKINSSFKINFDQTLKIIDYELEAKGGLKKGEIKFKRPKELSFIKKKIINVNLENTEYKLNISKNKKKTFNIFGSYQVNNNLFQKFKLNQIFFSNKHEFSFIGDFNDEIDIPVLNFNSENKVVNIATDFEINDNNFFIKSFKMKEGKNNIVIKNLILKNNQLIKFDKISVKTAKNDKVNNDFTIIFDKKIMIDGLKYDATNLTIFLEHQTNNNFSQKINKKISVNIKEIITNVADIIYNFNLIGNIDKGKFIKITSKGEFQDGKYLDISLKEDTATKKRVLEIYSDFPKPLLSNYKFFKGLTGGKLLVVSIYDSKGSNTNLSIENFKVKDAPGLVKLLSLADFGGMVDALSGDGLSFEKLEMKMTKDHQVLTLNELYAIGPSVSILMDGYVESKTGLVSLRGTMVPAKTLNRFLSKLPLVGDILIPKEIGEGLFGISFKMKGAPGKIRTTVNPIKTLTPRFIQKALKKSK